MSEEKPANQQKVAEPDQLTLPVGAAEEEIGARLRKQRRKRRISVEEAARALKLAPSTLHEIEKGELGRFESLYRRGYLRNYARFLGLDPEPLLQMLRDSDLPPLKTVVPVGKSAPKLDRFLRVATYAIVTTLIIPPLVLIYIQGGLGFLDRERGASVDTETSVVLSTEQVADVLVGDESGEDSVEAVPEPTGPVTASALPLSPIRPVRDPEPTPEAPGSDGEIDASAVEEAPDPRSVLQVELLSDSWLEIYAADGERLEFDLLRAGEQREFSAEAPFRLLVGRGNAVQLSLDGEAVEFDGQGRGDIVRFEIGSDGTVLAD